MDETVISCDRSRPGFSIVQTPSRPLGEIMLRRFARDLHSVLFWQVFPCWRVPAGAVEIDAELQETLCRPRSDGELVPVLMIFHDPGRR